MSEHHVDIVVLQPLQRALQTLNNVLLAQPPRVGLLASRAKVDLGRQHVLVARPRQLFEGIAHLHLALALRIYLGRVEEIDAVAPRCLHALLDNVALLRSAVRQPPAQREHGHLQSRGT